MCIAQVRNVHKNEDMARYYRLKDKVRCTCSTSCVTQVAHWGCSPGCKTGLFTWLLHASFELLSVCRGNKTGPGLPVQDGEHAREPLQDAGVPAALGEDGSAGAPPPGSPQSREGRSRERKEQAALDGPAAGRAAGAQPSQPPGSARVTGEGAAPRPAGKPAAAAARAAPAAAARGAGARAAAPGRPAGSGAGGGEAADEDGESDEDEEEEEQDEARARWARMRGLAGPEASSSEEEEEEEEGGAHEAASSSSAGDGSGAELSEVRACAAAARTCTALLTLRACTLGVSDHEGRAPESADQPSELQASLRG